MTRHRMVPEWLDPDEWSETPPEDTGAVPPPDPAALAAAGPAGRTALLVDYLRREAAALLQTESERIDATRPLTSIGIGSMMGLELQQRIREATGVELDLPAVLRSPDLTALAADLADALADAPARPLAAPAGTG
ncbi:acyl carrier protein [Kitasatospora arboriphila]|uniref:Carrier domain-containing protein n=1 Tax=Kitasatospora arboriphila TaxID=258052 RepID=A0ABN1TIU9_9ACTN